MKKILLTAALTMISAGTVYADSNTGCGLGSLLWDGKANTTVSQAFQATTNATFGNQTFGITTGTLGCSTPAKFVKSEELNRFVKSNSSRCLLRSAPNSPQNCKAILQKSSPPIKSSWLRLLTTQLLSPINAAAHQSLYQGIRSPLLRIPFLWSNRNGSDCFPGSCR